MSKPKRKIKVMKAISLFSGMGGDSLAIHNCKLDLVAYSEKEKDFQKTHDLNFPNCKLIGNGDILKTTDEEILKYKDVNFIFAGFPCQGFSNAGQKLPDDPRNTLFREFLRTTRLIKPKYIIGENVKGLINNATITKESIEEFYNGFQESFTMKKYYPEIYKYLNEISLSNETIEKDIPIKDESDESNESENMNQFKKDLIKLIENSKTQIKESIELKIIITILDGKKYDIKKMLDMWSIVKKTLVVLNKVNKTIKETIKEIEKDDPEKTIEEKKQKKDIFKMFVGKLKTYGNYEDIYISLNNLFKRFDIMYIDIIKYEFEKLGYDIYYKVIKCNKYGVPQNRERLIIVGIQSKLNKQFSFPPEDIESKTIRNIIKFSMEGTIKVESEDFDMSQIPDECIIKDMENDEEESNPHPNLKLLLKQKNYVYNGVTHSTRIHYGKRIPVGGEIVDIDKPINTIICTYARQPRFFIPQQNKNGYYLRCLLPYELKQIQGFPADYKIYGDKTRKIVQIGNAVPPPVIERIIKKML